MRFVYVLYPVFMHFVFVYLLCLCLCILSLSYVYVLRISLSPIYILCLCTLSMFYVCVYFIYIYALCSIFIHCDCFMSNALLTSIHMSHLLGFHIFRRRGYLISDYSLKHCMVVTSAEQIPYDSREPFHFPWFSLKNVLGVSMHSLSNLWIKKKNDLTGTRNVLPLSISYTFLPFLTHSPTQLSTTESATSSRVLSEVTRDLIVAEVFYRKRKLSILKIDKIKMLKVDA